MVDTLVGQAAETEAARAARELEEVVQRTEIAAREWGVRPDHLEGRFVSALLGCLTWLGRIMQATVSDLKASSRETRAALETELETLRTASKAALRVLQQAETALASSDVQRQMAVGKFVETIALQMVKVVGEAVVIRERRYNQRVHWGRAAGIATVAGGLLLGGYVWGGWHPDNTDASGARIDFLSSAAVLALAALVAFVGSRAQTGLQGRKLPAVALHPVQP
jgi:hypothetical protein